MKKHFAVVIVVLFVIFAQQAYAASTTTTSNQTTTSPTSTTNTSSSGISTTTSGTTSPDNTTTTDTDGSATTSTLANNGSSSSTSTSSQTNQPASTTASTQKINFEDIPQTHWAYKAVTYLSSLHIMHGYKDKQGNALFKPKKAVTRAQAAIMLVNALKFPLVSSDKPSFKDVPKDYFAYKYIETAAAHNLFSGHSDGTFGPNQPLRRSQMSVILSNAFFLENMKNKSASFNDIKGNWAFGYINSLYYNGISHGSNGAFMPKKDTSRGEFAIFLARGLNTEMRLKMDPPKTKTTTPKTTTPKTTTTTGDETVIEKGKVNADLLYVHEQPSINSGRLGGLKNGQQVDVFSDDGTWLKINYNNQWAFIYKKFVDITNTTSAPKPSTNPTPPSSGDSGSTSSSGSSGSTSSTTSTTSTSPTKGMVTADLLNVRSQPNLSASKVGSLNAGDQVDIYEHKGDWLKIKYNNQWAYVFSVFVREAATTNGHSPVYNHVITIDPGHGGRDPGTSGNGLVEKEINLSVAKRVAKLLTDAGAQVVMTRYSDVFIPLDQRVAIGEKANSDIFVSIHTNASTFSSPLGTETYFDTSSNGSPYASRELASDIQNEITNTVGTFDRGTGDINYIVLRDNKLPAVLTELGFISNSEDAAKLGSDHYRDLWAQALFNGISDYFSK